MAILWLNCLDLDSHQRLRLNPQLLLSSSPAKKKKHPLGPATLQEPVKRITAFFSPFYSSHLETEEAII